MPYYSASPIFTQNLTCLVFHAIVVISITHVGVCVMQYLQSVGSFDISATVADFTHSDRSHCMWLRGFVDTALDMIGLGSVCGAGVCPLVRSSSNSGRRLISSTSATATTATATASATATVSATPTVEGSPDTTWRSFFYTLWEWFWWVTTYVTIGYMPLHSSTNDDKG